MIGYKKKLEGIMQGIHQFVKGNQMMRSNPKPIEESKVILNTETKKKIIRSI